MITSTNVMLSDAIMENRFSAEFFDPKYVFTPNDKYEWRRIGQVLQKCQYGISVSMNEDGKGYPIIRMNEIENCFVTEAAKFADISKAEFQTFRLNPNDVLFNRTNSMEFVGRTGLVKDQTDSVYASYLVRAVPNKTYVLPEFLAIYLNTVFGKGQIKRRAMPSINQANVSASELRRIPIPLVPIIVQEKISDLVKSAYQASQNAKHLLNHAQRYLEAELGLDKLMFDKTLGYDVKYYDIVAHNRADAEFHDIKFAPILSCISHYETGYLSLNQITSRILPNFTARNHQGAYDYIEIGDISISDGSYEKNLINAKYLPANAKIRLAGGEIIVSQVRPTRGAIAIIDDHISNETICSGAFYVFTANEPLLREIIWLYLRTMKMVFEKYCGGTSYPTIESRYLDVFPVPNFTETMAKEIGLIISKSRKAKREADELLEQAKTQVEGLIEEAV